ncbi:unnamed protein product [Rotaria sordida]|uniref:Arrestin-like N-terminal domain-containing protein n=1 Tax=Rotaria sordida TaxID=392033 RepID=A0A814YC92_9BILA|nr:unnamed protein product [Rotaria sordida]
MGCGASNIDSGLTIKLTNRLRDASIFLSGEQVECTVHFDSKLYDPDVEIKEAYIELLGQVGYTTSSIVTVYNHTGSAQTITHTDHRIPFFCERYEFYSESASEKSMTLSQFAMANKWTYKFTLPDELPSSLPPVGYRSSHPYIEYFIRMVLELKNWYQNDIRNSIPLIIYPRINLQNELQRPIEIERTNRKHIHIRINIAQNVIFPRIPFIIDYNLENPNRSTVQAIIVQLCQNRDMGTCGHYNTLIFDTDMFDGNDFKGEHLHNKFELTLPTHYLAPTSSYKFGLISGLTQCNPASVTYELIVDVKVSGLFNDFTLKCPIIMGVELNDERPPSYASAMNLR